VHVISTLYFIPDGRNLGLGDKLFKIFDRYIQKNRLEFDIIHAHFAWPQGYVAIKLGEKYGYPVVITGHGHDVYDLPFRSDKWFKLVQLVLFKAKKIITVSKSNFEIIVEKINIDPKKVFVIPNGFSGNFNIVDRFLTRKKLNLPTQKRILLNVANLVPIKGHKYLIEAMKIVSRKRDDAICVIVGDGPLKSELEKLTIKEGLEKRIIFTGAKPHEEIPFWMNAADIFVLPSLSEGNPTVMFEALGVGLPFVGTAVGGVPEIITSEDYGLLCKPGDAKDLAEKILIALEKEWDREKIRKYAEQFTWDNIAKRVVKVYERIIYENP
ncbi:MAG: glycosyltransferase family 4 protein, partial [Candidatus Omnitrophica bacterium]|nr:glycosyltransferase family 4 protein [Candidatus Omnitrophota bacterium]